VRLSASSAQPDGEIDAMDEHEKREGQLLAVYIPLPDSSLSEKIWRGSGIVGSHVGETGRLRIDFEGDEDLYPTFIERVERAAERHNWSSGHQKGYPTQACAHVDEDRVIRVGYYLPAAGTIEVGRPELLARWLGIDELDSKVLGHS
jgi:hypothetical protein